MQPQTDIGTSCRCWRRLHPEVKIGRQEHWRVRLGCHHILQSFFGRHRKGKNAEIDVLRVLGEMFLEPGHCCDNSESVHRIVLDALVAHDHSFGFSI